MRRPRVFSVTALRSGEVVQLDENAARHLMQALRLQPGAGLTLFDGSGSDFAATLVKARKGGASARVGERLREEPPLPLSLHLALGISRGERMDFSIQKAVELGVSSVTPLFTDRSMVQLKGERQAARLRHWDGVVRHACEQSGRSRLPRLHAPLALRDWLSAREGDGILLDHRGERPLTDLPAPSGPLFLLVGPEGGLSPQERALAARSGLQGVRLGPRVLRTETAPLAALAIMQALWGDFRY